MSCANCLGVTCTCTHLYVQYIHALFWQFYTFHKLYSNSNQQMTTALCAKIGSYSLFYVCDFEKIEIHTLVYLWNYIKSAHPI